MRWIVLFLSAAMLATGPDPTSRPVDRVTNCTESGCHAGVIASRFLHAPASAGECSACHVYLDAKQHTFKLKHSGAALCNFCHIGKTSNVGLNVHKPVAEGKCLECHNPHGAQTRAFLKAPSIADNCRSCHDSFPYDEGEIAHTPVEKGNCLGCHEAHSSMHAKLLVDEGRDLCLRCHEDLGMQAPAQPRYGLDFGPLANQPVVWQLAKFPPEPWEQTLENGSPLPPYALVHEPVRESCADCHSHHASDQSALLVEPPLELCGSCHEDVLTTAAEATFKHSAVTEDRACLHCHTPHISTIPGLLADTALRVCAECHSEPIKRSDGKEINWVEVALSEESSVHGPLRENCSNCHNVHGGPLRDLLVRPYTQQFYASNNPDDYALCLGCHDSKLINAKRTLSATGFRNGTQNLHYLHVKNPGRDGRSCRACHSTHAAAGAKLLHDDVAFGQWTLPIGFVLTDTGGSCAAGCHRTRRYDREHPVLVEPAATP